MPLWQEINLRELIYGNINKGRGHQENMILVIKKDRIRHLFLRTGYLTRVKIT
jgi:hypothetical protein